MEKIESDIMIYVTGNCHSDFKKFSTKNFSDQKDMTKDDYVIIWGDFWGIWDYNDESKEEFCGHYHRNEEVDKKTMILYDRIVKIV